jgi:hypothetical protein
LIVSGIILASGIFFTEQKTESNLSQQIQDAFNSMEETGYLITEVDTNISGAAQNIYNKLIGFFPDYMDFNVSIKVLDLNSIECRNKQTFSDCFVDSNEFTYGSSVPSNKTIYYGKKIIARKQPPGECDTNSAEFSAFPTSFFSKKSDILFFQGDSDLNFVFDVNTVPSDVLECDQNITVNLTAAFPPGYRRPVDIMLVIDRSGSMSWGGRYDTYRAMAVDVNGNTAYIADYYYGLRDFNVESPLEIDYLGRRDTYRAMDVFVDGSYAYIADYSNGIEIIDVSNPSNPFTTDQLDVGGYAYGIVKQGNYVFAANGSRGIDSYNVINPNNIIWLDRYNTPGNARGIDVDSSYAYVADGGAGLRIINICDPSNLTSVDSLDVAGYAYRVKKS